MRHEATPPFRLPGLVRGAIAQQQLRSGTALEVTQDQQVQDVYNLDYTGNANTAVTVNPTADGLVLTSAGAAVTLNVLASEALAHGDLISFHDVAGVPHVRKANATDATKIADGFVNAAVANGAMASVLTTGQIITGLTGLTAGVRYFLDTTGGAVNATAPSASGNIIQEVGVAISTTTLLFIPKGYSVL